MVHASVYLVHLGVARLVGVVDDRPIRHEQADDVGELAGVAEVDRVRSALDLHDEHVAVEPAGDLLHAFGPGHERIPITQHPFEDGRVAATLLLEAIAGREFVEPVWMPNPRFVPRESSGTAPA